MGNLLAKLYNGGMPRKPKKLALSHTIRLRDGREIATLPEAVAVMEGLPPARQSIAVWVTTQRMLIQAMASGDAEDMRHATAQLQRALQFEGWAL